MSPEIVKQILEPITQDNPAGVQLDDDPDFDRVSSEIQKLESLHSSSPVDWGEVVRLSSNILSKKSKDIRLASWLCMGLFQQDGYAGLAQGLEICLGLLQNFWDSMYPPIKRIRGRSAAFIWLASKIVPQLLAKEPSPSDTEAVRSCGLTIEKLTQLIDEKFGDHSPATAEPPNILDLRKTLQSYALRFKAEEKAQTQEVKEAEQRQQVTPSAPPPEFTSINSAHQMILRASAYIRESQPNDPISYRLDRIIRWHTMTRLPPNNRGRTELPGVIPQLAQAFLNLLNSGDWEKLLRQSESNFVNTPLWLDLQRFIDRSMFELGEMYEDARKVVREELATLVKRFPEVTELQFKNGTPFADDQTRMWIESEVMPSFQESAKEKTSEQAQENTRADNNDNVEDVIAEAKRLTLSGEFQKAISMLLKKISDAPLRRTQFIWKLNLAELCIQAGHYRLAIPILEALDNDSQQFSLDIWEPNLSAGVVKALLQCKRRQMQELRQPSPEMQEQVNQLYSRLCQLDILSALELEK